MVMSSPTTRRTRSRTSNSPSVKIPEAAAKPKLQKNAASPANNKKEDPLMPLVPLEKAAAMETEESADNDHVKNNADMNASEANATKGVAHNKSAAAEDESRNDAPAKAAAPAAAAAVNNDASTDNTEVLTDTTSSSTSVENSSALINSLGGAMEVSTPDGEASSASQVGAQKQQQQPSDSEKLASVVPANNLNRAENDSTTSTGAAVPQKEIGELGGAPPPSNQQLENIEGKTTKTTETTAESSQHLAIKSEEEAAVIATANKITKVTALSPPSNAAATTADAAATTTSEQQATNNSNASSNNNNNNNNNNHTATAENNSSSSSPNSFSMTLAIGPSDTQRLFVASKTFNEEIQKMRSIKGNNGTKNIHGGGAPPPPATTADNREGSLEKKRKADSDSDTTADGAAAAAIVQSSPSSPSMVISSSSNGASATTTTMTPSSKTTTTTTNTNPLSTQDQIALLLATAKSTSNPLISSFMSKMKYKSTEEQETCLLFFLDADKSTKLLMAFDVLSDKMYVGGGESVEKAGGGGAAAAAVVSSSATKDNGVNDTLAAMAINDDSNGVDETKVLSRRGLTLLFQSFLTSISTCVHNKNDGGKSLSSSSSSPPQGGENKSPNCSSAGGDWTGSEKTAKEISEVAIFAANHLIEYAKKEEQAGGGKVSTGDPSVSFDQFGKWYNSGGFSLVPWLELLDLSKWDYTLKTNKNVAIEQVPLGGGGDGAISATATTAAAEVSSSAKRAKFDDGSTPVEAIGSPTGLFESGAEIGATPQPLPSRPNVGVVQSFSSMFGEPTQSRNVVSFDFSGTAAGAFHIDITEENLVMLRQLVTRTGFAYLTPHHVESVILKHSRCERRKYGDTVYVISRQQFGKFIRDVVPKEASKNFDPNEIENFSNYFTNFFTCFDYNWSDLKKDEVNAKELMVGFSFLCAGNKSSKLAAAYDMLDVDKNGYLTQRGLMQYLRAYLTMLAGISLLSSNKNTTTQIRKQLMSTKRNDAFLAVENGAKWTLGHFFRAFETEHAQRGSTRNNAVAFEDFAKWYTEGGYAVAPWLELLDLQKFLSLIGDFQGQQQPQPAVPAGVPQGSPADVLFTFPLAKERSLVVLRDDAHYVRAVVSEMGLLSLTSEDIWATLSKDVTKRLGIKKSAVVPVDQASFVDCMMRILSRSKKPPQKSSWANFSPEETLKNFFLSFDLMQVNQVPLNQLMCGLTLLCGGTKSSKLGFAFGLFCGDGKSGKKKIQTMGHGDFIQFFRSFLIVMFSCCNQSLSLSADTVSQYISDTAQAVADAVMKYWKAKKVEKVKFDHFSKWYNEGGFQMAPWLELLDLHKWVLADDVKVPAAALPAAAPSAPPMPASSKNTVPVVHAPINNAPINASTMDRDIFNALVASPNPKDRVSNVAPSPCPI